MRYGGQERNTNLPTVLHQNGKRSRTEHLLRVSVGSYYGIYLGDFSPINMSYFPIVFRMQNSKIQLQGTLKILSFLISAAFALLTAHHSQWLKLERGLGWRQNCPYLEPHQCRCGKRRALGLLWKCLPGIAVVSYLPRQKIWSLCFKVNDLFFFFLCVMLSHF